MFSWKDYFELAKKLRVPSNGTNLIEAELRSSISRAYYSIYHDSEEFCKISQINIPAEIIRNNKPEKSSHLRLISALKNYKHDSRVRNAGNFLDTLRNWRDSADYDNPFKGNINTKSADTVDYVDQIYNDFNNILKGY